jgi:hypothetical protein
MHINTSKQRDSYITMQCRGSPFSGIGRQYRFQREESLQSHRRRGLQLRGNHAGGWRGKTLCDPGCRLEWKTRMPLCCLTTGLSSE